MPRAIATSTALLVLAFSWPGPARSQCLLVNPSFELTGSGGAPSGWNRFGPTGSSTDASHGHRSARVSGPNTSWGVAGYWQDLETSPGGRWVATVHTWNTSAKPLTGDSRALLNVEWRDAGGGLISYESFTVADAGTPTDRWVESTCQSGSAPTGTTHARLVLAVLQGPTDPQPEVRFDQATFDPAGPPTLDDIQWNDFPGGRTLSFSGRTWRVKGPGFFGPGPNLFSNSSSAVWVDASNRLHLTLQSSGGQWYSTEVALEQPLGYGDYVFTTVGQLDQLDPAVVFGLFLWQYGWCYDTAFLWWNPFDEVDVEFSRWGNPSREIAQFVAQPFDYPGNVRRFDASFSPSERTSHAFRWLADRVEFRSWRGGPLDESAETSIDAWTYTGPHIPRPEQPRPHVNLWRFAAPPGTAQEVILEAFTFVPATGQVGVPGTQVRAAPRLLEPARPNPLVGSARIRYAVPHGSHVELTVYDLAGRRIRTLENGLRPEGVHEATWDGRDASGRRLHGGLYLICLRLGSRTETERIVLLW